MKPPIDWPRVFAIPPVLPEHLARLNDRISHWPALVELCAITGNPLESFNLGLMVKVRDFFLIVKRQEWDTAEAMYDEILQRRLQITQGREVPVKTKRQPVG
jgi:hypothetical protein